MSAEFKVKVSTSSDTKGSEETRGAFARLHAELQNTPGLFGKINVAATAAAAAVTAAIGAVVAAFAAARKAVAEFASGEERFRSLAQAVANTGQLTREYAEALQKLAAAQQEATNIAADEWIAVLEQLTKHGANAGNIERYARAVEHLAGIMGPEGNIDQAALIFSRAISGNYEVLRRFGVEIDNTKSKAENLESILRQLEERGFDILRKRAQTLNGEIKGLKLAFDDFMQTTGGLIARTGILQVSIAGTTALFKLLGRLLPENKHSIEDLNNVMAQTRSAFDASGAAVQQTAESMATASWAIKTLGNSYAEAEQAASRFEAGEARRAQVRMQRHLAEIEFLEAAGILPSDQANRARSALEMQNASQAAEKSMARSRATEGHLRADESAAFNQMWDAEERAKGERQRRDALLTKTAKFFGVPAEELKDPKRLQELISKTEADYAVERANPSLGAATLLGMKRGPKGVFQSRAARPQALSEARELQSVLLSAAEAEAEDQAAKERYQSVFAETSPRREAAEMEFRNTATQRETAAVRFGAIMVRSGGGFDEVVIGAKQNARGFDEFARTMKGIMEMQLGTMKETREWQAKYANELETLKTQFRNARNR